MATQTDIDWWSPQQVAARWNTSYATIKRRSKLPADDPAHIKTMPTGKSAVRIHISEILRHEDGHKIEGRRQETIVKPPPARKVSSLLEKRMRSLQQARQAQEGSSFAG